MDANLNPESLRPPAETTLAGLGISPGLGMGPARVIADVLQAGADGPPLEQYDPEQQLGRIRAAVDATRAELEETARRVAAQFDAGLAEIFRAHGTILASLLSSGELEGELRASERNAEAAVARVFRRWHAKMQALEGEAFRQRADDIVDLGRKLLRRLRGETGPRWHDLPPGCVLVLDRLLPSDVVTLSGRKVAAVVVASLGQGSHAALLAREKSIATVAGFPQITERLRDGDELLVDGYRGTLVVGPGPGTRANFEARLRQSGAALARCKGACRQPAYTLDRQRVAVEANIGVAEDVALALDNGADGVGLLRVEQLYLARELPPTEDELLDGLRTITAPLGGRPITIRLLDVGGDKPLPFLRFPDETNPALGRRGVRLLLEYAPLARTQLAALLRLAQEQDIRVLVPMVTLEDDVRTLREWFETTLAARGLRKRPPLGAMIETPAAALNVPALARHVDFFSVGTNDLTQYTLAAGRDDPTASRYYRDDHASVLRLLNIIVADAGQTPVTVCGELAGREEMIPQLLASGFRALSMAPQLIPTAKERIRNVRLGPEPGEAAPDGAAPDGAAPDGAAPDGAAPNEARIEAAELRALLASGQPVTVLDARSAEAWHASRVRVPGAVRLGDDEMRVDPAWPRERLTVVYCTCPRDAGAAAVVGELRARGFSRAAVLRGGFDAWEAAGGPVESK